MRRFYAVLLAHAIASYVSMAVGFFVVWGSRNMPRDGHDVLVMILWPVLQILLVPHYVLDIIFRRFDWSVSLYLTTHAVTFVTAFFALRRFRRHGAGLR